MVRYAVENGIDQVAWTTGDQQAERYKSAIRKHVDWIRWEKTDEGIHLIGGKGGGKDTLAQAGGKQPEKLDDALKTARDFARKKLA